MKLQTKINYRFLTLLLLVFLVAGGILYVALGLVVSENLDEILARKSEKILQDIDDKLFDINRLPNEGASILIKPVQIYNKHVEFSDTVIQYRPRHEGLGYRQMKFITAINQQFYEITLLTSRLETDDLMELVFYFMLCLFVFIVLILFLLNRWLLASIWQPFYKTINRLKHFKIGSLKPVMFDYSNVHEFSVLNNSLINMIQKAQADFNNLKEFTANASHEIQTPLAVIKSNLEIVLQDQSLIPKKHQQLSTAYTSAIKLSKLTDTLLLLSKIENQQFLGESMVDLSQLIRNRLSFLDELIEFKKITIQENTSQPFRVKINSPLAEILINNLIGNAIKHNIENGFVRIESTAEVLTISNSGHELEFPLEKLFQRFSKQNSTSDSSGLGLAIAYKICDNASLDIKYLCISKIHSLMIAPK